MKTLKNGNAKMFKMTAIMISFFVGFLGTPVPASANTTSFFSGGMGNTSEIAPADVDTTGGDDFPSGSVYDGTDSGGITTSSSTDTDSTPLITPIIVTPISGLPIPVVVGTITVEGITAEPIEIDNPIAGINI